MRSPPKRTEEDWRTHSVPENLGKRLTMIRRFNAIGGFILIASTLISHSTYAQIPKDTVLLNGNHLPYHFRTGAYPDKALDARIEGLVMIAFTVDTLCQISKKHVVQGIGYGCDEVALQAIDRRFEEQLMKANHFQCHTGQMTVPVNFKLHE
jgi:TonB family protein